MTRRASWQNDADLIRNPGGTIVSKILPDIRDIEREEFIKRVIEVPRQAYIRGWEAGRLDPDGICDPPAGL